MAANDDDNGNGTTPVVAENATAASGGGGAALRRRGKKEDAGDGAGEDEPVKSGCSVATLLKSLSSATAASSNNNNEQYLPPLPLVFVVLACSGTLFVLAFRDFWTTGRNVAGTWDEAYLVSASCRKSEVLCFLCYGRQLDPPCLVLCWLTPVVFLLISASPAHSLLQCT